MYRSLLECVPLQAGHTYYVVVDGYATACGDYTLEAGICPPCTLTCQANDSVECAENPDSSHTRLDCDGGCNNPDYGRHGFLRDDSMRGHRVRSGIHVCAARQQLP